MAQTVREARIEAATNAMLNSSITDPLTGKEVEILAEIAVGALFTDHSLDNIKTNG